MKNKKIGLVFVSGKTANSSDFLHNFRILIPFNAKLQDFMTR